MKLWLLIAAVFLFLPSAAKGEVLLGVSDSGKAEDYISWSDALERRVPTLQTFHTWGTSLNKATKRWSELDVLPILHVSTNYLETPPTLAAIARGEEDAYLLELRESFYRWGRPALLRPLGEPNRPLNNYSAFLPGGQKRGAEYSQKNYIRAFRRIAILTGSPNPAEDLAAMRLPPLAGSASPPGNVSMIWSPLPGREGIRGNGAHQYWPGERWVDIVGTSFFSKWPYWRDLKKMQKRWKRWPFWLVEWGITAGKPRFIRDVYRWCQAKCQGMVYYQGFGDEAYQIERYPLALKTMRSLSSDLLQYPLFAEARAKEEARPAPRRQDTKEP